MVKVKLEISVSISGLLVDVCENSIVSVSCDFNIKECQRFIMIYYENFIKSNFNNSTQTWSIIKKIMDCKRFSKKSKLPSELSVDNEMINTNSQIFLDKLYDYVANLELLCQRIFQKKKILFLKFMIKAAYEVQSFAFQEIDEEEVNFYINNIKVNSAPGLDGIPPRFVKLAKTVPTPLVTKIFNKCIQHEIFPNGFKTTYVISVPKVLSLKSLNDLSPIHISSFCPF